MKLQLIRTDRAPNLNQKLFRGRTIQHGILCSLGAIRANGLEVIGSIILRRFPPTEV